MNETCTPCRVEGDILKDAACKTPSACSLQDAERADESRELLAVVKCLIRGKRPRMVLLEGGEVDTVYRLVKEHWLAREEGAAMEADTTKLARFASALERAGYNEGLATDERGGAGNEILSLKYNPNRLDRHVWKEASSLHKLHVLQAMASCARNFKTKQVVRVEEEGVCVMVESEPLPNALFVGIKVETVHFEREVLSMMQLSDKRTKMVRREPTVLAFKAQSFVVSHFGHMLALPVSPCKEEEDSMCSVCFARKAQALLVGCGHVYCLACTRTFKDSKCCLCQMRFHAPANYTPDAFEEIAFTL
jgi:hypothetical protein